MKKLRVYFRSKTETVEQVAKKVSGKLRAAYGMALFSSIPQLTDDNKQEWDTYMAEAHVAMKKRVYEIDKLYIAATAAVSFTNAIKVLSTEAVLIDIDKVCKK